MSKKCNTCSEWKDVGDYTPDTRNKDGLQSVCKPCRKKVKQADRAKRIAAGCPTLVDIKTCNKCKETKQAIDFYRDSGISDGLSTICKSCKNKSVAVWQKEHREKYNADMRTWRADNKEAAKNNDLKRYYGITLEEYNVMVEQQGGVCKLCKKAAKGKRPLVVDHCHTAGVVRGALCYGCNRLIVALDDHPLHKEMLEYLSSKKKAA